MLPSPCYVISDLHLGVAPPEVERDCLRFLHSLAGRAASLVVNGDLFDFWFEWRTVIPRRGFRAVAALADLREAGVEVLWVAGNHDCWGGEVLTQDVGLDYHVGAWDGTIAGWRTRIEHGDGLRPVEDKRYRALRRVLRHPASIRAFRLLHPDLGSRLASGSSHASRTTRPRDGGAGLRRIALDELASEPALDLVLYGHSHVPALERGPTGGVYANAGSWLDSPTFLRLTPERIELRRFDGSAEGECLDVLDRRTEEALAHP
ncbi:MAG TPA: UDP-2,3-diacylglucosamine diphosphatase [Gemmatimonadaceae bacterium]|nr:UDP-2,3-diacylglucosamine diphosphatase [Gemmatimonadaceae bacterium]